MATGLIPGDVVLPVGSDVAGISVQQPQGEARIEFAVVELDEVIEAVLGPQGRGQLRR
ncbi:MAG: hypothetical protein AAGB14_14705 [Verrucomicrobiota bacterium]